MKDKGLATPIIDEAEAAAKKKKEEMDREIESIKKEYEEKMKKKSKGKGKEAKDKDKEKGKNDAGKGEDDEEKAEKEKDAKVPLLIAPSNASITYHLARSKQLPPNSLRLSMTMLHEYMRCKSMNIPININHLLIGRH